MQGTLLFELSTLLLMIYTYFPSLFYVTIKSVNGGAIFADQYSTLILDNVKITRSYAQSNGGAISIQNGLYGITNSYFENNMYWRRWLWTNIVQGCIRELIIHKLGFWIHLFIGICHSYRCPYCSGWNSFCYYWMRYSISRVCNHIF